MIHRQACLLEEVDKIFHIDVFHGFVILSHFVESAELPKVLTVRNDTARCTVSARVLSIPLDRFASYLDLIVHDHVNG